MSDDLFSALRQLGFEAHYSERQPRDFLKVYKSDYAELSEKDFETMLSRVQSLSELQGIANRRSIFRARFLKRYSEAQVSLIKQRKWQLEQKVKK